MPSWTFVRSTQSGLYFYSDTGTPVPGKAYTLAFLPPASLTNPPASFTLAASWQAGGVYVFYQDTPPDEAAFEAALFSYLTGGLADSRFLWIENAASPASLWTVTSLPVRGTAAPVLSRYSEIALQNYRLCLNAGIALSLVIPTNSAAAPAFLLTLTAGAARLACGNGEPPLTGLGSEITIPLAGASIGTVGFTLTIAQSAGCGPGSEMAALNAGNAFFYPDPDWDGGYITALSYPLISPAPAPLGFYVTLDPLNARLPARSLFGLFPTDGSPAPGLTSYCRNWVGSALHLTPMAGAGFALSPAPRFADDPAPLFSLTPVGSFILAAPAPGSSASGESVSAGRIMCGLSAVEYLGYVAPQGGAGVANVLTFYPGQPAYAPSFDPGSDTAAAGGLTPVATTSYATVSPNGPPSINYYSQPDRAVYFDPSALAPPSDQNFLDLRELVSGQLSTGPAAAFPMVAFAGLDPASADITTHARFEGKVLSPSRRTLIFGASGSTPSPGPVKTPVQSRAVTRSGMLGFFGAPTASSVPMVEVQLGQSDQGAGKLRLAGSGGGDITGLLQQALLSNQLFLVISSAPKFAQQGAFLTSILKIGGFPFDLSPDFWDQNQTLLILKFSAASIENLAADLGSWCSPDAFCDGAVTQADLIAIIDEIRANAHINGQPNPDYIEVYNAITDPGWNGLLAFNVEVGLQAMPRQLAGIAAGMDPAAFRAHHLGLSVSPVNVVNGVLEMRDSALFALINYVDATPFTGEQTAFRVSQLKILFSNAEIRDFACEIDLLLPQMFASPVVLLDTKGEAIPPVIALNGYYQHTETGDVFSFTSRRDLTFRAVSDIIDEVEITGAEFVTLNPHAAPDPSGVKPVATQFVFTGMLRFHALPGFDALSFGTSADGVAGGIAFSNLIVHMNYGLTAAGQTVGEVFRFDAATLAIDMASSVARPQSLFAHFPLKFKGFIEGKSDSTPLGLGYLAAATPINEVGIIYPWYGLLFELNLGTFGALAASAGFTAEVLIGWSAAPGLSLYTGIKIPGASPQNLSFALEGVIGLSINDISFTATPTPHGDIAYTLVFSNIALRILGLKFPASAYVDMVLFGNPDPSRHTASLGWYAAYSAK